MNAQESFNTLYDRIAPELSKLEELRLETVRKLYTILIPLVLGLTLLTIFMFFLHENAGCWSAFLSIIAVGAMYLYLIEDFVNSFKDEVIAQIIHFLSPGLYYNPGGYVSREKFNRSLIFPIQPNVYKGDDYIKGRHGDTFLECSELHAQYETGSGKNRRVKQIFNGLFFMADFNKHFNGKTFVLPDKTEKLFGSWFGNLLKTKKSNYGELVRLENPEFEEFFVVYADDQIEARYILSTSLMERIVELKKKAELPVYISFVESCVCIAIGYKRNLFEPNIFQSINNSQEIRRFFNDLSLILGIVEDLNLNTRIWSKGASTITCSFCKKDTSVTEAYCSNCGAILKNKI